MVATVTKFLPSEKFEVHNRFSAAVSITLGNDTVLEARNAKLLEAIAQHGSITTAARKSNISYAHAWHMVDSLNKSFDQPLVVKIKGGEKGGGAVLTELGFELLDTYKRVFNTAQMAVVNEFEKIPQHLFQGE